MNKYNVMLKYKRHGVTDVVETWDFDGETGIEACQKAKECLEHYNTIFDPKANPVHIIGVFLIPEVKTIRIGLGNNYIECKVKNSADLNEEDFYKQVIEYVCDNLSIEIV